jgi:hypothetical protein
MRRNPTLPPSHVMKALRGNRFEDDHPYPTNPVVEPCCQEWAKAHEYGRDCENHSWLIAYEMRWPQTAADLAWSGAPVIGTDLMPVRYCPWCGIVTPIRRVQLLAKLKVAKARA